VPTATARAHPNIALCKYWGKRDRVLNLPSTPSLSLTLAPFTTVTQVTWGAPGDRFELDGRPATAEEARKVWDTLDRLAPGRPRCQVESRNDFPTAAGLASSASGFAALVVAAAAAGGLELSSSALAVSARRASGSATRSLQGGWVHWPVGERPDGLDSHGVAVAPPDWWDVRMVVAVVASGPKAVGSTEGMVRTERTSPYYAPWVAQAEGELAAALAALRARDLSALGPVVERSALRMHASMWAADPPIVYQAPATLAALQAVTRLRASGVAAWATMDAGPNVKVLCAAADAPAVAGALAHQVETVRILHPGGPAEVVA